MGLLIGLTGGIGAGKSTALREFSRLGARTMALDAVSHEIMRPGGKGYRRVLKAFGPSILDSRGNIDRAVLGRRVFSSPAMRDRLERLTHPLILDVMRRWAKKGSSALRVIDVPLLFEKRLSGEFDATVLVAAGRATRLNRAARRDAAAKEAIARRMKTQLSDSAKRRLADAVIANDGTLNDFRRKIREYDKAFKLIQARGPGGR